MNFVALTASPVAKKKWTVWLIPPVVAVIAMAAYWTISGRRGAASQATTDMLVTIAPMDLDIKIIKDGELQAVNNIDIISEVEGATTIQTLVKEGTKVSKGDILITLDSSAIKQKIEDTTLELQRAEAEVTNAREMREIQLSTNAANLEAAQVALTLAQLDLKQYNEGSYPQLLANAKTTLSMAEIDLKNVEEKLGQTRQLFSKGFVTATAVKDDELLVTKARNTVEQARTALAVLTGYTHQSDMAAKENALSQGEQRVARTKRENAASMSQRTLSVSATEQAQAVLKRRMERFQLQFNACTIKAPADGLVVYATSGERFAENRMQEGATVRERQLLLRLPDSSSMKAVLRVAESQVSRLNEGMRARVKVVGLPQPLGATLTKISILADSGGRFFNDVKEYPVDLTLDETPSGLRPGMTAQSEIFVDRGEGVLAVPLATIFSAGPESYVFVREGNGYTPKAVRIGRTNETHAELRGDAVHAGDQVLVLQVGQGQELLDKAGIQLKSTTQPSEGEFGGRRRRGNGGGGGGAGGGAGIGPAGEGGGGGGAGGGGGGRRRRGEGGGEAAPAPAPN